MWYIQRTAEKMPLVFLKISFLAKGMKKVVNRQPNTILFVIHHIPTAYQFCANLWQ
jgi:hypothetical protein